MENVENTNTTESNNETETKAKEPKTPAWVLFHQALQEEIKALGLEEKVQENYVQVLHAETGQRIYIAKQDRAVTHIPTTMDLGDRPGLSRKFDGTNGKIAAEIEPTVDAVREALALLAGGACGKVRSAKRTKKEETAASVEQAPAEESAPVAAE